MDLMHPESMAKKEAPIYRELADEVQRLIDQSSLRVGQRLPSVRVTARQRQISIGTAMQAYVVLENRGYIEARPKSGYYVRIRPQGASKARAGSVLGPAVRIEEKNLIDHMMDLSLDPTYFPLGNALPAPWHPPFGKDGAGGRRGGAVRTPEYSDGTDLGGPTTLLCRNCRAGTSSSGRRLDTRILS